MSKSALYTGLSQGLMSLGKSAGRAMEFTAMETLRQQNLEKNWARQDAARAAERNWRSVENQKDRVVDSSRQSAEELRWDATQLTNHVSSIDSRFDEQSKTLRENLVGAPEELETALRQLETERDALKLRMLHGAPASVLEKSGLKNTRDNLLKWAEAMKKESPALAGQTGGEDDDDGFFSVFGKAYEWGSEGFKSLGGWVHDAQKAISNRAKTAGGEVYTQVDRAKQGLVGLGASRYESDVWKGLHQFGRDVHTNTQSLVPKNSGKY